MVTELLDISRLEKGKMPLEYGDVDLLHVIKNSISPLNDIGKRIVLEFQDEELLVCCDTKLISRVIVNLVSNALKFSPEGTGIKVRAEKTGDGVGLSVIDQGSGIPNTYRDKIFEKFGQAQIKNEAVRKISSGLGLAFCKLAIEAHKGEIGVKSENGKGSTFWFSIPKDKRTS